MINTDYDMVDLLPEEEFGPFEGSMFIGGATEYVTAMPLDLYKFPKYMFRSEIPKNLFKVEKKNLKSCIVPVVDGALGPL